MNFFILPNKAARLIVLQRIELISPFSKKLRKFFGRYIFSNFITRYFLNSKSIGRKYHSIMLSEFLTIEKFITPETKNILSIGGGLGGLESLINKKFTGKIYHFIERNFISKKVKYGWGGKVNSEAYNDLSILNFFLETNGMQKNQINIYDYDNDNLPKIEFDLVISLLSLDYHYDFELYIDYLRKVSKTKTKIIFDTIRADYFKKVFKNVEVIQTKENTVHKSKRIICSEFLN